MGVMYGLNCPTARLLPCSGRQRGRHRERTAVGWLVAAAMHACIHVAAAAASRLIPRCLGSSFVSICRAIDSALSLLGPGDSENCWQQYRSLPQSGGVPVTCDL